MKKEPPELEGIDIFYWMGYCMFSRWWFQTIFIFSHTWGNDPILTNIFQMGWNHQLVFFVDVCPLVYNKNYAKTSSQLDGPISMMHL